MARGTALKDLVARLDLDREFFAGPLHRENSRHRLEERVLPPA